jgi:DNA-binding CsgD family transcriptional regulator
MDAVLDRWLERLRAADSLVEVARAVLTLDDPRALWLELLDGHGSPVVTISVQDFVDSSERRLEWRCAVRTCHTVVSDRGALVGPICSRGRVMGVVCFRLSELEAQVARGVAEAVCIHTAVRLAELGFDGPRPKYLARLSQRQRAVARVIASGCSTLETATQLGISPNTVKKHLKDIFDALDIVNRSELAAIVTRHGASIAELEQQPDDLSIIWSESVAMTA